MCKRVQVVLTVLFYFSGVAQAMEPVFVEDSEQIVEQILKGGITFSRTRSFSTAQPETRGIQVQSRNAVGQEKLVTVQVPVDGVDQAARLKVEFDVNSARLRSGAYPLLAELGRALHDERVMQRRVCIKGHTDADGDDGYNLKLSYARAASVLSYLHDSVGLAVENLEVFGYGESMPLAPNNTPRNKQLNRRVEVSLNCPEID